MKHTVRKLTAVLTTLCMLLSLFPAALAAEPATPTYIRDTDGVDSGAVYAIFHAGSNRILYHENNKDVSDHVTGAVSGDSLTLDGGFLASRQLWTITGNAGNGYTIQSLEADGRYLNLNQVTQSGSKVPVTDEAQALTITAVEGGYTISRTVEDQTLYLAHADVPQANSPQHYVSDSPCTFQLFKLTEEETGEPEPTDPLAIPGYTQLTEMPEGGLDPSKYYLVVTADSDGNRYALYINQAGTSVGSGALKGVNGACTATLTVSKDTVTAAYLNGETPLEVDDLRITVNNSGAGYTFRSGDYGLALNDKMYSSDYISLSVSADENGLWTIKNTATGRLLSFNQNGNTAQSQYPNHITDFWGPNGGKNDGFPIYLYVQDNAIVPVDKGALNAAIAQANSLEEKDYTSNSWSALQTALTAAQQAADDGDATQTEVNEACAALQAALDALVRQLTPPEGLPTATVYQEVTGALENGVYAILYDGSENGSLLYHNGNGSQTDQIGGSANEDGILSIASGSAWTDQNVLWTLTKQEDGSYTLQNMDSGYYLDLSAANSRAQVSSSAVPVTVTEDENGYTITNGTLALCHKTSGQYYIAEEAGALLRFFQKTEVPAETVDREALIPQPGTTQNEPFAPGTGGSDNFRIPSIITLDSGRILAAIDARWNHLADACGLDTIVSYSDDGGKTWNYSFPNYFGDSVDSKQGYATAFIDPVMVQGNDGTIYLMVDLFPGGVAINTAPMRPAQASGYVDINGTQRLALYLTGDAGKQTDTNYTCYVGDFVDGYAKVYNAEDHSETGYYVDDHYYLYYGDGSEPDAQEIYCQRIGSSEFIQQNVFFYNADLHVRCATYLWLVTSKDGGETWSAPTILNPQVRTGNDMFYGTGPGAGLCLEDGTILLPAYTFNNQIASFVYSTDGGVTWTRSDNATPSGHWSSESCLVQIDGTTVRHFYRDGYSTLYYTDHTWNGEKWVAGAPVNTGVTNTHNNQLSAIKYSKQVDGKDAILVSTATGALGSRTNGKIYTFVVNEDKTMELVHTYEVTGFGVAYGYSSLSEMADGSIALLYEGAGSRSVFTVISAADLGLPESPTVNATASVTGDTQVSKGEWAEYTFSLGGDFQVDSVDITFTISDDQGGALFDGQVPEGLNGFIYDKEASTVTKNADGSYTYHAILYFDLEQEAATAPLDVLSLKVRTTDHTGDLTVTLDCVTFALYGSSKQTAAIDTASVTTTVQNNVFDVNGDGSVDVGDVSAVRLYYQSKAGDENWSEAKKADLNNDGVVDVQDLILVAKAVLKN